MRRISESSIQEVKDRLNAVTVVSDYVKLENRGGRWWARCPFHQEKTASFTVNAEMKTYYCFGCQKGASVLSFVMEMDKLSYPEAIEMLARKSGVTLAYESSDGFSSLEDERKMKAKEELGELYERLCLTFRHCLLETKEAAFVREYIASRGIQEEMAEKFRLGYSPADRYWLFKFLQGKGYSKEFLDTCGLFSKKYNEVAFFSNRLMFPITDRHGKTVAFGGRILPEAGARILPDAGNSPQAADGYTPPKYVNSPEIPIYKKGQTLFALNLALDEVRRTKTVYLGEGYMDVIALHQAGITNAVAPLGTAFSSEQAKVLSRWAEQVIFFFDSDEAGKTAAAKGVYVCRSLGLSSAVVQADKAALSADSMESENAFIDAPKDPADILLKCGAQELQKVAKCFINDIDYLIQRARTQNMAKGNSPLGKAGSVASLFPYVALLDSKVARDSCIETIADAFSLFPKAVDEDFNNYLSRRSSSGHLEPKAKVAFSESSAGSGRPVRLNDELSLLIVVAVNHVTADAAANGGNDLFQRFRASVDIADIEDPYAKEIFLALEENVRYGETGVEEFLSRLESQALKAFFIERSASGEFQTNQTRLVTDGIKKIKRGKLKHRQQEIILRLRELKKDSSGPEAKELLAEKMRVDSDLNLLKV